MARGKRGDAVSKSYEPSDKIKAYFKDKLQIEKIRREVIMKGKRDWTIDENREMNRLDKSKSDILNNIIFPSMANLTVFLEGIAENKELQKVFDDDLKQLLLGRKITIEIDKETKDKKKRFGPIVFQRFIRAAITWNYREKTKNENESEYEYESEKDREKKN
jgi:hypothetical protein